MQIKEITTEGEYQGVWQAQDLHILQSWAWGQVKETEGWKLLRIGLYAPSITHSETPSDITPETVLSLHLKTLPFVGGKFAYVPKISHPAWGLVGNLKLLKVFLEARGITFAIIEYEKDYQLSLESSVVLELKEYGGHIQPQQTNLLKLGRKPEEIFMAMDGKYRRNIKKSLRDGVTVMLHQFSPGAESELPVTKFYSVMESIFKNTGLLERGKDYFQSVWNLLGCDGRARILLAELNNEVVGAYLTVNDNKSAYELYGGVTPAGREVEAGYLLKWEALKFFNALGLQYYDNWGVAPKLADGSYDPKNELFQISKFKEGFGGEYVQFPQARALVVNRSKYSLFQRAQLFNKLKTKIAKLFK